MLESLLERFQRGDRLALSRLLSYASEGEQLPEILAHLKPAATPGRIVAITGSGGVGKSTLVGKLIELVRRQNHRVAVLACDPQSPVSGGALLGDRFRMASQVDDDGVFIRSLAAAPGHGAVAEHLEPMIRLLESFGFGTIFIETVGAGQGDTAVADLADVIVLLLQPETGDDLQWEKAGLLEVADIVVVNKGDLPRAEQVEAQVRSVLGLTEGRDVPILRVSAKTGDGIEALWAAIQAHATKRLYRSSNGRELVKRAQESLANWFSRAQKEKQPELMRLIKDWEQAGAREDVIVVKLFRLFQSELPTGSGNSGNDCP
jgi:LAO/AO transport system ATPase